MILCYSRCPPGGVLRVITCEEPPGLHARQKPCQSCRIRQGKKRRPRHHGRRILERSPRDRGHRVTQRLRGSGRGAADMPPKMQETVSETSKTPSPPKPQTLHPACHLRCMKLPAGLDREGRLCRLRCVGFGVWGFGAQEKQCDRVASKKDQGIGTEGLGVYLSAVSPPLMSTSITCRMSLSRIFEMSGESIKGSMHMG